MKKYIKIFSGLLVLVLATVLVSGCSTRTSSAPKTFTIWGFDDEDVWKPIIKEAQKDALKGYEVKYVKKVLNDSYENDSLNSILSGQGPDVWAIPNDWVYRHKDKLTPMPDTLIKSSKLNLDDQFVPAIKQSGYFDNKVYALSPTVDTIMVYYNEKVFQATLDEYNASHKGESNAEARKTASKLLSQVPTTWSNFTEASKLLTTKSGNGFSRSGVAMGTINNVSDSQNILYALMLQDGSKMTSDDFSLATFNLPQSTSGGTSEVPAKKALEFYNSFANAGSPNYSWNASMPNNVEAFVNGQVGMIFGFESLSNHLAQVYPGFKYKKAPLPQIGSANDIAVDYASYIAFAVPKLSASSGAAWQTINMLSTTQASSYSNTIQISQSAKKKDFQISLKDREGNSNPGKVQTQTAQTWVKGRYPNEADSAIRTAIDNVVIGKQDAQSALDLAASTTTTLLRKTTW